MANIVAIIHQNMIPGKKRFSASKPDIYFMKVDAEPDLGTGTEAPVGSFAIYEANNGLQIYFKYGTLSSEWRILATEEGSIPVTTVAEVTNTSYSVQTSDDLILVNPSSDAEVTITLPAGSSHSTGQLIIKDRKGISSTWPITVEANGSETIDGQSSFQIAVDYRSINLFFFENEWSIL